MFGLLYLYKCFILFHLYTSSAMDIECNSANEPTFWTVVVGRTDDLVGCLPAGAVVACRTRVT